MTRSFNHHFRVKTDYLAAFAVTLAPILYFLPALRNHAVLCPDDGFLFNVPLRVTAAQMILAGRLPLWNPYIFSGMPLLASAQGGLLFPPNWSYLVFSPAVATNLMVVSTYMIAALGAYLYARRTGASVVGATITSLIWQWGISHRTDQSYQHSSYRDPAAVGALGVGRIRSNWKTRARGVTSRAGSSAGFCRTSTNFCLLIDVSGGLRNLNGGY